MHHHPLGRIEREWRSMFHSFHEHTKLRTDERSSSVRRINVHPDLFLITYDIIKNNYNQFKLLYFVKL